MGESRATRRAESELYNQRWISYFITRPQPPTQGIREHIEAMRAFVESTGGAPVRVKSHPIRFGSGEWTCVVGELEDGRATPTRWVCQ